MSFATCCVCLELRSLGALITLWSIWFCYRAMRENSFAAPVIKLQRERGQRVISTGPYAFVRHPMYFGAVFHFIGTALLLGSWWGVLFAFVLIGLLCIRIPIEEKALLRRARGLRRIRRACALSADPACLAASMRAFDEIAGPRVALRKNLEILREAHVPLVPLAEDHAGARKQRCDQPEVEEVVVQFDAKPPNRFAVAELDAIGFRSSSPQAHSCRRIKRGPRRWERACP